MELSCVLAPLVYAELYALLASDASLRPRVEERLEAMERDPSWLDDAARGYRALWDWRVEHAGGDAGNVQPAEVHDARLATWILAPLRACGPSTELSAELAQRVARQAREAFPDLGRLPREYECSVVAWTLGRVCGDIDRTIPVVPAQLPDDAHVAAAYLGLLEHVCVLDVDLERWPEMLGSSIIWRVAGIAEGLHPLPKPNLALSIGHLMNGLRLVMPTPVHAQLAKEWEEFRLVRNGFTHIAPSPDGYGFADVMERMRTPDEVRSFLRGATYFVCNSVAEYLAGSEDPRRFQHIRADPLDEFAWAL